LDYYLIFPFFWNLEIRQKFRWCSVVFVRTSSLCPHHHLLREEETKASSFEKEPRRFVCVVFVLSRTGPTTQQRRLFCVELSKVLCVLVIIVSNHRQKIIIIIMVDVAELKAALDKLEMELKKEKQKNAQLVEENALIKAKSASLVSEMEKEEEHITNALMRRIETMSLEKKNLMLQIDAEEEHISNALQKKLDEVMKQKVDLERQLESETEFVGNKLQRQVDQLARDKKTLAKERERLRTKIQSLHDEGEKLRREKVAIEHSLETEEENIVNKLQAQIQKLLQQNVLLERKLNRLQGGNFAATSDSEQSEDGYSSTYSARAAYLSSSPRSARSGTSTRDASDGMGSRGGGHHANRGDFITSWQRGAYAAHSKENSSNKSSFTKKEKDKEEPTSESGSQRKSLDIPSGLGRMNLPPHRTLSTGGPGSTYSQSGMTEDNATNATTHGNETPMSLPTTPRSGLSSVQHPDSEND
tara:strand:+ start:1204 stop:2619 length:1416 start_codon:yes stop_codon:yes gene_type:complete